MTMQIGYFPSGLHWELQWFAMDTGQPKMVRRVISTALVFIWKQNRKLYGECRGMAGNTFPIVFDSCWNMETLIETCGIVFHSSFGVDILK